MTGLFNKIKLTENGATNTESGEVVAPNKFEEKKQIMEEARQRLGIYDRTIETREQFLRIMRKRALTIAEYSMVKTESQAILSQLAKDLEDFDTAFKGELKMYYDKNCPFGKKTLTSIYGDLGERFQDESFALSEDDRDVEAFEKWLLSRPDTLQKAFGVEQKTYYVRDMKAVHAWWKAQKEKPKIPGTVHTPAGDKFSIRPSLDTIKKDPNKYVKYGDGQAQS